MAVSIVISGADTGSNRLGLKVTPSGVSDGNPATGTVTIQYGTSPGVYTNTFGPAALDPTLGQQTYQITGLAQATQYYFLATYDDDGQGQVDSTEVDFTTGTASVSCDASFGSVDGDNALTFFGQGLNVDEANTIGFLYGTVAGGPYPSQTSHVTAGVNFGGQNVSESAGGLAAGTTYYYRTAIFDGTNTVIETSPDECELTTTGEAIGGMAEFDISKTTDGPTPVPVGSVITSTVDITNIDFLLYYFLENPPDMDGWVETVPTASPGASASALDGIKFFNGGATIGRGFSVVNPGATVNFNSFIAATNSGSSDGAAFTIRIYDGANNAAPLLTTVAGTAMEGAGFDIVASTNDLYVEIERSNAAGEDRLLHRFAVEERLNVLVDITDEVPLVPAGITRTWTATHSGGDGNLPATAGVGSINWTDVPFGLNETILITIMDTVPNPGTYQNEATVSGDEVAGSPASDTGQEIEVEAVDPGGCDVECIFPINIYDTQARLRGESAALPVDNRAGFEWGTTMGGPYPNSSGPGALGTGAPQEWIFDLAWGTANELTPGTTYYYRMVQYDDADDSVICTSDECSFTTRPEGDGNWIRCNPNYLQAGGVAPGTIGRSGGEMQWILNPGEPPDTGINGGIAPGAGQIPGGSIGNYPGHMSLAVEVSDDGVTWVDPAKLQIRNTSPDLDIINGANVANPGTPGMFNMSFDSSGKVDALELQHNTTYQMRARLYMDDVPFDDWVSCGDFTTFDQPNPPCGTPSAITIDSATITVNADVASGTGGADGAVASYSPGDTVTITATPVGGGAPVVGSTTIPDQPGEYTGVGFSIFGDETRITSVAVPLTGLLDNTEYEYTIRVDQVINGGGTIWESEVCDETFTTTDAPDPFLQCEPATDITTDSATLNASGGNLPVGAEIDICWGVSGGPFTNCLPSSIATGAPAESFSAPATGLTDNTSYGYVVRQDGVVQVICDPAFTTVNDPSNDSPSIEKVTDAGPFAPGDEIRSVITISNPAGQPLYVGDVTDDIPISPAGLTRRYTSVATGGATGNTLSGIGDIYDQINIPAGGQIVYTMYDLIPEDAFGGTYENFAVAHGMDEVSGGERVIDGPADEDGSSMDQTCEPACSPNDATTFPWQLPPCNQVCPPDNSGGTPGNPTTVELAATSATGADCAGAPVNASGVGVFQTVPHPDAVQRVLLCNPDQDTFVMCDTANDNDPVLVVVGYDNAGAPQISYFNMDGSAFAGDPNNLAVCGGADIQPPEIDQQDTAPVPICFNDGLSIAQWFTYERVLFNNQTQTELSRTRRWFNPIDNTDTAVQPAGAPVSCAGSEVQVVEGTEVGCADGVTWSRFRTAFFNPNGTLVAGPIFTYADAAGNVQGAAPANFVLGACFRSDIELTVEQGCAAGVPWTRVTRNSYNDAGDLTNLSFGWYDSDGNFTDVQPEGWVIGGCLQLTRGYTSTVEIVEGGTRQVLPILSDGSLLFAWSVRHRSGTVTVTSGPSIDGFFPNIVTLDPGEVISFDGGDDPTGWLNNPAIINADAGSARVTYQYRLPPL